MRLTDGRLQVIIEGASHAPYVGVRLAGLPLGFEIDQEAVQAFVDKRRASKAGDTPRREPDRIEWIEGIEKGVVTGDVVARIANTNVRSGDYAPYNTKPRPSHADYAAIAKYGEGYDVAGGGAFSGRMTAPMCIAGGIALQYLATRGITLRAGITRVGKVAAKEPVWDEEGFPQERAAMLREIEAAQAAHDSVGGQVTVIAEGVPAGWGDLMGDSLESRLSSAVFGVPAVKGVSFGAGFDLATMRGSEANDPFAYREGKVVTTTNHAGGINGGLANGQPIVLHAAFRPTPSIGVPQRTVDLSTREETTIMVGGRHDACIVRRGQYAVLSAVAIVLAGVAIEEQEVTLATLRGSINSVDSRMRALFEERMGLAEQVGEIKHRLGLPILDANREEQIIRSRTQGLPPVEAGAWGNAVGEMMRASRLKQSKFFLIGGSLPYSHSPAIHASFGLDYGLKEVTAEGIPALLHAPDFVGCNVTIPHKQAVIPYLDEVVGQAKRLEAVNTVVKAPDGRLLGYNTDYEGMRQSLFLNGLNLEGKVVAILGTGATSRTAQAVAEDMGAHEIIVISRTKGVTYSDVERYRHAEIVINTTPLGTYPNVEAQAVDLDLFDHLQGVMDLTYNPLATDLLLQAKAKGVPYVNGLPMLCIQAAESAKLWGAVHADWRAAYRKVLSKVSNIVLIGMPSSGKTTLGREVARLTGKEFVDVDEEIVSRLDRDIPTIFAKEGEGFFRAKEAEVIREVALSGGKVIATGGGAVKNPANIRALSRQGHLVWVKRDLTLLVGEGRPLSSSPQAIARLLEEREPLYRAACDYQVDNNRNVQDAVKEIVDHETTGA